MYVNKHDQPNDINNDSLVESVDSIQEAITNIENSILFILHHPDDHIYHLNNTLDALNIIEAHCREMVIDTLVAYINTIKKLIEAIKSNNMVLTENLTELIMISMDELRCVCKDLLVSNCCDEMLLKEIQQQLKILISSPANSHEPRIKLMINTFSTRIGKDLVIQADKVNTAKELPIHKQFNVEVIPPDNEDLSLFRTMSEATDSRSPYWNNRTDIILYFSLLINKSLAEPMNEEQLTAAVYMHDTGMAYLPDEMLDVDHHFNADEEMLLEEHPILAYEILKRIPGWEEAATIVHQHHERFNGSGFPNGLSHDEIHIGAKIIAVADNYAALTEPSSNRPPMSILRAVSEINQFNGTYYDPNVIMTFNNILINCLRENSFCHKDAKVFLLPEKH